MMSGIPPLTQEQRKAFDLLYQRFCALTQRKDGGFVEKTLTFKTRLLQRYEQARVYVLFSLFTEVPVLLAPGPFDFPGEDSIERFINAEYAAAYPEHALFSLLVDAETEGSSIPEAVRRFLDEQYDPTIDEVAQKTSLSESGGMEWLEKPLQLISPIELTERGKLAIPPEEHPFHVEVKDAPAPPPPPKGFSRFIKRLISGKNASGEPR